MKLPFTPATRAWHVWAGAFVVLALVIVFQAHLSHVTSTYFPTAETWWSSSGDIYDAGRAGYLYLPQSVWLFSPFLALPAGHVREIGWRFFGLLLFAFGLRRVARRVGPGPGDVRFEWGTALVLVAAGSSAHNGQTNMHLAGLMLHAAADLMDGRWWRASALLWLGMLAKPVALVMVLLAGALYRPARVPLLVGLIVFLALPFVHPHPSYVLRQLHLAAAKLRRASQPGTKPYEDAVGLLRTLGVHLPQLARTALAAGAALVTLGLTALGIRRGSRAQGAWLLASFAACYLMLFNPRTETNSYVILVPVPAVLAAVAFERRRWGTWTLMVLACLALGTENYGTPVHEATHYLVKPAVALLLWLGLAVRLRSLRARPLLPGAAGLP
jgi:hypothetical protein